MSTGAIEGISGIAGVDVACGLGDIEVVGSGVAGGFVGLLVGWVVGA